MDEMKNCIEAGRKLKLSKSARMLWQTLVHLNNATYWSEWFYASTSLLEDYTATGNKTLFSARDELCRHGIIAYKSKSGMTTQFKLLK